MKGLIKSNRMMEAEKNALAQSSSPKHIFLEVSLTDDRASSPD